MRVHFVGIGGIGVSALAQYYLAKGHRVSGSDLVSSEITNALKKKGAKLLIGKHKSRNLANDANLVIYSPAVREDNPELKAARKKGIKCLGYPEALGELTKKYFTIAVSGTHGKSTTTAMIGLLLTKAGFDPTVIVGTKLKEFGNSNCRVGESEYLVIEADEHFGSFLNYWPRIIVLTNIEREHLDYFKNLRNILKTYQEYISHLPKDGILVANKDDKNIINLPAIRKNRTRLSSIPPLPEREGRVKVGRVKVGKAISQHYYDVVYYSLKDKEVKKLKKILKIPGEHNISNALAALRTAQVLKIPDKISFQALSEYKGSWRRFEEKTCLLKRTIGPIRRQILKFKIISDYAHHPTEIKVTLKAAREKYPNKQIWCVYQPHQYQRTFYLFDDFVRVFREALRPTQTKALVDKLIITDIYDVAGREKREVKEKVSSEKLVQTINNQKSKKSRHKTKAVAFNLCQAKHIPTIREVKDYLKKNLRGGEVVIIMGAGDIYNLFLHLTEKERREKI